MSELNAICPSCEREIYADGLKWEDVCPHCGAKVDVEDAFDRYDAVYPTKGEEIRRPRWKKGICPEKKPISPLSDFQVSENGELLKYIGSAEEVVLPPEIRTIGDNAFKYNVKLRAFYSLCSLDYIGESAFESCKALREVYFIGEVKRMKRHSFAWCKALSRVYLPEGLTNIGGGGFQHCESLEAIVIPSSVRSIDPVAFNRCRRLKIVVLNEGLNAIHTAAFGDCSEKLTLEIPASVMNIDPTAIISCKEMKVAETNAVYRMHKGCLIDLRTKTLLRSYGATEIPSDVPFTAIENAAFKKTGIIRAIVPDGVTRLGDEVFGDCGELLEVSLPEGLTEIGKWQFFGCKKLKSVVIREGLTEIRSQLFKGCQSLAEVKLPATLRELHNWAFQDCPSLKTVEFGVTEGWYTEGKPISLKKPKKNAKTVRKLKSPLSFRG